MTKNARTRDAGRMTELDAVHYRKNSALQRTLADEVLSRIPFKENEVVLDVGCGEGRITAELATRLEQGRVIGIDPSSSMIALAKASYPQKEYPNLYFETQAAEELKSEVPADTILLLSVLHWIRNPRLALGKLAATLKPGGKIYILTYPKESKYWDFLEETASDLLWRVYTPSAYPTVLTGVGYKNLLEEQGLKVLDYQLENKIATYGSEADLVSYLRGWIPCYLKLPSEKEMLFIQQAAQKARSHSIAPLKTEIQLSYTTLILSAQKLE